MCGGHACQRTSISGHPAFAPRPHRVSVVFWIVWCGGQQACQRATAGFRTQATSGRATGQAGPDVAGHSFRPPAMARVGRGASHTMLPQDFWRKTIKDVEYFTFSELEMQYKYPLFDYLMKLYLSRKYIENKSD